MTSMKHRLTIGVSGRLMSSKRATRRARRTQSPEAEIEYTQKCMFVDVGSPGHMIGKVLLCLWCGTTACGCGQAGDDKFERAGSVALYTVVATF